VTGCARTSFEVTQSVGELTESHGKHTLDAAVTDEDYVRYIPLLEDMSATLRVVADGQRPLLEACDRIAASMDRIIARLAQVRHECEARDAKRHAMSAGLKRNDDSMG